MTFETIFPGWYTPRTCHIHVKIFTLEPYAQHTGSYTTLEDDMVYDGGGASSGLLGGGGGTPPEGGTPPSAAPSASASS